MHRVSFTGIFFANYYYFMIESVIYYIVFILFAYVNLHNTWLAEFSRNLNLATQSAGQVVDSTRVLLKGERIFRILNYLVWTKVNNSIQIYFNLFEKTNFWINKLFNTIQFITNYSKKWILWIIQIKLNFLFLHSFKTIWTYRVVNIKEDW